MKNFRMVPVRSKAVFTVGYDLESRVMRVRYANGGLYEFAGVEPEDYAALMSAASIGKHLGANFSGGVKVMERAA